MKNMKRALALLIALLLALPAYALAEPLDETEAPFEDELVIVDSGTHSYG